MKGPYALLRKLMRRGGERAARVAASPLALLVMVAGFALLVSFASSALARPGGGHGYSGGGGGGGSSGGGDGGFLVDIFIYLLYLCVEQPLIGIPLMLLFIAVVAVTAVVRMRRRGYKDWDAGAPAQPAARAAGSLGAPAASNAAAGPMVTAAAQQRTSARRELEGLRREDPNFSTVLLEDFLYALFAEIHRARGGNRIARLAPYLSPEAQAALSQRAVAEVSTVIVGAMRFLWLAGTGPSNSHVQVGVEFEANYTERWQPAGAPRGVYIVEHWHLSRRRGVQSRTPDRAQVIGCPSCGAPLDVVTAGHCSYCNQQVNNGALDWIVQGIQLVRRESRGPLLTSNVQEQGTNLPTIRDPNAQHAMQSLMQKDPQFNRGVFQARLSLIFSEFQVAWSSRDLARMRPFLSDNLFQTQLYWIETYKQQRLRNVTDRARITHLELAKIGADRFYDSITVRLYATGLDYTVSDEGNRVVSGSTSRERAYSEYWTLVRGSARAAPSRTDKACPNCGAPLQINMAGYCEYCKAKVTSGEFDWVLSKIEQDESYDG